MIRNEQEFEHSQQLLERVRAHRDRCAAETLWDPDTREDIVDGVDAHIRKLEREIAEYLAQREAQVA